MSSWQPVVKLCLLIKGGNQYNYAVSISDLIKKTTQGKKLAKADSSRCVTDRDYTPVNLLKLLFRLTAVYRMIDQSIYAVSRRESFLAS